MRHFLPLIVTGVPHSAQHLTRRPVQTKAASGYDERWLQEVVHQAPVVLPIAAVEPSFWPLIPICMELPLAGGTKFVDNLLVTPWGDLVVVECKLWRNGEARREVVAQAIDYAREMQALSYDDLQAAIRLARKEVGFSLYNHVSESSDAELHEAEFIDAVSRNLRLGRCLLAIVGDGITEGAESLTEFLQQHAGMHFRLIAIQLAIYDLPDGQGLVVVPSIPLTTTNIVRGVVEIRQGAPIVSAPGMRNPSVGSAAMTLSEEEFYASLDRVRAGTAGRLRAFLDSCTELGLRAKVGRTLFLKMTAGEFSIPIMAIYDDGRVETGYGSEVKQYTRPFFARLAAAIPGTEARETPKTFNFHSLKGHLTIWDLLSHEAALRQALVELSDALRVSMPID